MVIPSPFVYWAQSETVVSLKIDLKNVTNPDVTILENKVQFSANGTGAHGQSYYKFSLDLYATIKNNTVEGEKPTTVRVLENRVEIVLQKAKPAWWPRVTAQPQKPAWLKIDFDLWKSEDGQDSDEEKRDIMRDYPGMYDKLQKEEMGYRKEEMIKVYMVLYNLFQFIGFMYILVVIATRYAKLGYDSVADTYAHVGSACKFMQLLQYLEVMHPMFGYTKGSALVPFGQIAGRVIILFVNLEGEPRMQSMPIVLYLFVTWSLIEVVRHLFYISKLYKTHIGALNWLRYSLWMPLYPIGILLETTIILKSLPYLEESGKLSVALPNPWNFTFHMPTILKTYLAVLVIGGIELMKHMYKLRSVHLKKYFMKK